MSTFDGRVVEFPDIRIDYFRSSTTDSRPPLAYFLSHVHSDHLVGLETCRSPFIYCSAATRDILLRLEKYPHRMNFAKGILETRKQTYKHLKTLLKAIPLETPTVIELSPGNEVRVTLFDANHCVGAVMFLIEGGGKAILYTGDIRSERWWIDSLLRNPLLLPYNCFEGDKSRLDCIYLDTTFVATGREDPFKHFPSKAEGLRELLQKIDRYPSNSFIYFDAWTFGYEDVWQLLSNYFGSQIHVDNYRYGLYRALWNGSEPRAHEASMMIGFQCGNHFKPGCLTKDQCRIHSCERGTECEIWSRDFVRITPIISRHEGRELAELGAGGGHGDLDQRHELEVGDTQLVGQLMALCATKLKDQPQLLTKVMEVLTGLIDSDKQSITLEDFRPGDDDQTDAVDLDGVPIEMLVPALTKAVNRTTRAATNAVDAHKLVGSSRRRSDGLAQRITFPYSRHSSYEELCWLIDAFHPKDVFPCTVDETNWSPSCSMAFLFGHIYNTPVKFRHDQTMLAKQRGRDNVDIHGPDVESDSPSDYATPKTRAATPLNSSGAHEMISSSKSKRESEYRRGDGREDAGVNSTFPNNVANNCATLTPAPKKRPRSKSRSPSRGVTSEGHKPASSQCLPSSALTLTPDESRLGFRQEVFDAVLGQRGRSWADMRLISVHGHQTREQEL